MNIITRILIVFIPISFLVTFYLLLTETNAYPNANYDTFELPEFALSDLGGNNLHNKSSLQGDLILNVWASWCITCRVEHPYLMSLREAGIPIIGLNYKDEKINANEWISDYGNPYNIILYDSKGNLALDMGVTGAPETFLINDGKVLVRYEGEINKKIWNDVFQPIIKKNNMF